MPRLRPRLLPLVTAIGPLLLGACGHRHPSGRMTYTEVASQSEGRTLGYGLYTPPGWDGQTPLPLVVMLHGAGDDETSADRVVVTQKLDAAITAGQVPPFLMVTPRGERGFWMNWSDGSHHYRDWVLDEVVPQVRHDMPVAEGGLHLMGVSMGGGGGMQMWLHDPSRFASATILSAPILTEEETFDFLRRFMPRSVMERAFGSADSGNGNDPYEVLATAEGLQGTQLVFGAASRDMKPILRSNERFHAHLRERSVPHRYFEFPGGHGWEAWSDVFPMALCHQLQSQCSMSVPESWTAEEFVDAS